MKRAAVIASAAMVMTAGAMAAEHIRADEAASADWPCWRGPTHNGIAGPGSKLADAWPEGGPKLLWKTPCLPQTVRDEGTGADYMAAVEGGCGSVVVADGKAFVYVHWKHKGPKTIVFTTKMLTDIGWMDGVPDDLAKKVEDARLRHGNRTGAELDAYIKTFTGTLDSQVAGKYESFIRNRISDNSFPWETLVRLSVVRDKEFQTWDEFVHKSYALGETGDDKAEALRKQLLGQGHHYTDTIVCLDANTGKELWKKDFPGAIPHPDMLMFIAACGTPAVWDGKCYAQGSAGFYCLDVKDGSVVWQAKTGFSNSSPMIHNGVVYCFVPRLTAFDAKTGKVIWTGEKDLESLHSSVVLWKNGGKDYIVGSGGETGQQRQHSHAGFTFCVDPATGTIVWKGGGAFLATPVIAEVDGFMALSTGAGELYKILPEGGITRMWTRGVPDHRGQSPLLYKGHVYYAAGRYFGFPLRCFDAKTGAVKWVGVVDGFGFNFAQSTSPSLADGKIIANVNDQEPAGSWTIMYRATPERFERLGLFHSGAAVCTSPTIANGRLYLRLKRAIACYDIAEHGPYMDGVKMAKDELGFDFKQAEGGLVAKGAIEGLVVTDASGKTQAVKMTAKDSSLVVDVKGVAFPVKVSYADSGNLSAKTGPVAPFEWMSPRLIFERCETNTFVMKFARCVDQAGWKSEKAYTVAGAKVTGVDLDWSGEYLRVTTDKTWKSGEKATVRYPAFLPGSDRTAESSFIITPGQPVTDEYLYEYLIGEIKDLPDVKREIWDTPDLFKYDDLDKNMKPVAGDKWKLAKIESKFNVDMGIFAKVDGKSHDNSIAHLCVYVHSETDCKVQFWVVGDDAVQIHVNGKPLSIAKAFQNTKIKDVEMKKGWNTVLMGLSQTSGGWGLSFSMRNEEGDGPPVGLRYTTELPGEK